MSATPGPFSPLHGIWRIMPSPELTEILAQSGADFQIFDREHGRYDFANLLTDMLACENAGCAPLVRVGGHDKIEVQRCLDLGARGLVFPQLAGLADFERAAAMMDYGPAGTRGFNPFVRAARYGVGPAASAPPPRAWFVPIVETLEAVDRIEAIVALERIDFIYIGAYDLSAQLGCAGRMDDPRLTAVMDRVVAACHGAGKAVGQMVLSTAQAETAGARGIQVLVHGVESHRFKLAASSMLGPMRDLKLPATANAAMAGLNLRRTDS